MKTINLIIFGEVQGVFFRVNVKKKADELGITGWVKNEFNGTVVADVQGTDKQLQDMINFLKSSPGASQVGEISQTEVKKDKYSSFDIKY